LHESHELLYSHELHEFHELSDNSLSLKGLRTKVQEKRKAESGSGQIIQGLRFMGIVQR